MDESTFNNELLEFIKNSPTPFHAVNTLVALLKKNGFVELVESDHWDLLPGQNYYVVRNGSSIVAFRMGTNDIVQTGVRMIGAHTDSPCLKVKPNPEINRKGYWQIGAEVYGGALFAPWFDRDLSIAGRVNFETKYRQLGSALVDFKDPIAIIPSLAIHLDRTVNEERKINAQKELLPVVLQHEEDGKPEFREILKEQILSEDSECNIEKVLDFDLYFYDTQPPAYVGMNKDFISSARLDNLLSCYVGAKSLLAASNKFTSMLVCNDHEEVGSMSASGAQGPFLKSALQRLAGDNQKMSRLVDQSLLISVDNAHGVHPNYLDKHDESHGPVLNQGPVIKTNANQRYATNSETSALFRHLCSRVEVPVQAFAMRNDMLCGSTIGPLTATEIGVRTLDVGVPQLAMHSIRELAGVKDAHYLYKVLCEYFGNDFYLS